MYFTNKSTQWAVQLIIGVTMQLTILGTILSSVMFENSIIDNIGLFVSIIAFIIAITLIVVAIFIPAEHAKQTKIDVIKYCQWKWYRLLIYTATIAYIGLAITSVAFGLFWFAFVSSITVVSLILWPQYIDKIDLESKQFMIEQLSQ